jgi:hypothetical protein
MECFLDTKGNDTYWYCGGGQTSCAKVGMHTDDNRTYYSNGQAVNFNNKNYVCCNATDSSEGVFKEIIDTDETKWKNTTTGSIAYYEKTVTVKLPNGTCTYQARYDGCGNEIKTEACTEATDCKDGYIKRNGKCVEPCPDGSDFESVSSNKCIECPTTMYQGSTIETITTEDNNQVSYSYCKKCDADNQFFNKTTDQCIEKNSLEQVSRQAMAKCFMCGNNKNFKECVACVEKDTCTTDIKTNCALK